MVFGFNHMKIKIKHRIRILKINDTHYIVYQRMYFLKLIPYWHKLKTFNNCKFKEIYNYADVFAKQQYPHILEIKYKN